MIPRHWEPRRRSSDGEHVGYFVPIGPLVVPTTLLGTPLGSLRTRFEAAELLDTDGLTALDQRWWCRLPHPMPTAWDVDASAPAEDWEWRTVVIVESTPDIVRVRLAMPWGDELKAIATLPVPVGNFLRMDQPR